MLTKPISLLAFFKLTLYIAVVECETKHISNRTLSGLWHSYSYWSYLQLNLLGSLQKSRGQIKKQYVVLKTTNIGTVKLALFAWCTPVLSEIEVLPTNMTLATHNCTVWPCIKTWFALKHWDDVSNDFCFF